MTSRPGAFHLKRFVRPCGNLSSYRSSINHVPLLPTSRQMNPTNFSWVRRFDAFVNEDRNKNRKRILFSDQDLLYFLRLIEV